MLRAIGKAILDSTKDPGTKEEVLRILELKVWVGISRAEGYVRLSLK